MKLKNELKRNRILIWVISFLALLPQISLSEVKQDAKKVTTGKSATGNRQTYPERYTIKLHHKDANRSSVRTVYAVFEKNKYVVVCQPVDNQDKLYQDARKKCDALRNDPELKNLIKRALFSGKTKVFEGSEFRSKNIFLRFISYFSGRYPAIIDALSPDPSPYHPKLVENDFKAGTSPSKKHNKSVNANDRDELALSETSGRQNDRSGHDTPGPKKDSGISKYVLGGGGVLSLGIAGAYLAGKYEAGNDTSGEKHEAGNDTSGEIYGYAYYRTEVRRINGDFFLHVGELFEDDLEKLDDEDAEDAFVLEQLKQNLSNYDNTVTNEDGEQVKKYDRTRLVDEDKKEYFKARLVDTRNAKFNLDGVHFGDYYGDDTLYKQLQTIRYNAEQYLLKHDISGLKEGPEKTKLFADSKKALEDHVKEQFLKFQPAGRKYAENEIEVIRWSSVVRKLDEVGEGSGKWPHLDLNIEKNKSVYLAIGFLADSDMSEAIQSWKKSDIIYMMNLWTPLQDDPVGVPLAFFSKNRQDRAGLMHFQGTREMAFAPKILSQWDGETIRTDFAPGFSIDKKDGMLTDAVGWIYKKDIKFGEYYLFDTRKTLHSAFLTGGPKVPQAARLSTEFRFMILKKNR